MRNKTIQSAEEFVTTLSSSYEKYMGHLIDERSLEWQIRNEDSVSGSSLSTCIRQAWYFFKHRSQTGELRQDFDSYSMKKIFLGYVHENVMSEVLLTTKDEFGYKELHTLQGEFPVTQKMSVDGTIFSATTDFVLEFPDSSYVPIELKTTSLTKWDSFTHWDFHVLQVMLWIHYAKMNSLRVPFGILRYERMDSYDAKHVVISVDRNFNKIGWTVFDYKTYRPYVRDLIASLKCHIDNDTLPPRPSHVPKFRCDQCPFREICDGNLDTFREEDSL